MRWVVFLLVLGASVGALGLGAWLGRRGAEEADAPPARATAAVAVGLLGVLLRWLLHTVPPLEDALFPWDDWALVAPWWAVPFAMLALGAGSPRMSTPLARRGVLVFALGLLLALGQRLWATATFDPATITGVVRASDGVCLQTTDYTCGAASAAMLATHLGRPADERTMCELCWTNSLTGTDALGVRRGLRRHLGPGWRVDVVRAGWDDLVRGAPALVVVQFGAIVDHWVLVLEATPADALVLDPLSGRGRRSKAELMKVWRSTLVTATRE